MAMLHHPPAYHRATFAASAARYSSAKRPPRHRAYLYRGRQHTGRYGELSGVYPSNLPCTTERVLEKWLMIRV